MAQLVRYRATDTFIGISKTDSITSGYGTAVARASWQRCLEGTEAHLIKDQQWGIGLRATHRTDPWTKSKHVEATIKQYLNYEGIEYFLYQLFGTGKTVDTTNSPAGLWTFLYNETLPIGLTLEVYNALYSEVFTGLKVKSATFELIGADRPNVTWELIGDDQDADDATPDTKTYVQYEDDNPVLCTHSPSTGMVLFGHSDSEADVTEHVERLVIKVENDLHIAYPVNQDTMQEPVRTDEHLGTPMLVTADMDLWVRNTADWDNFQADQDVGLKAEYEGGVIATTYKNELTWDIPFMRITGKGKPTVIGSGLLKGTLHMEAHEEQVATPDPLITMTLQNDNVTAIDDS